MMIYCQWCLLIVFLLSFGCWIWCFGGERNDNDPIAVRVGLIVTPLLFALLWGAGAWSCILK